MEWLFIFGLAGVAAYLWNRMVRAERRLDEIDRVQEHSALMLSDMERRRERTSAQEPADYSRPASTAPASVPTIAKRSEETRATARVVGSKPDRKPEPTAPIEPEGGQGQEGEAAEEAKPALLDQLTSRISFDFEDIFGRRLPIWAGGVTLAIAGVFLVRYAIDAGLLTPLVRVALAFLFGLALLGGAEAAYRFREKVADPRVAQALAGAGLATLYAGFYLAGTQYGLVGQTVAFLGLAAVTAAAIGLSYRFGLPSAVLGLVGGFAAPVLVGGEEANLPLLSLYLGLVTAGLTVSGRQQGRAWMAPLALVGGLGWGALLLLAGDPGFAEVLALGLYFVVLGAVIPALAGSSSFERPLRLASAAVASVQLGLLVEQGGFAPLAWGLYLLLGATLAYFGWRKPQLREASGFAAAVGVILLALWDGAAPIDFAVVATALTSIFAVIPLAHIWRGTDRAMDLWQLCTSTLALAAVTYATFGVFGDDEFEFILAAATALFAALPALAAWRLWTHADAGQVAIALAASSLLLFGSTLLVTPSWLAPIAASAIFAGIFALLRNRDELAISILMWSAATITVFSLLPIFRFEQEFERLGGGSQDIASWQGLLRWLAVAAPFVVLAWRESLAARLRVAEALSAILLYGALAQVLPGDALAWMAAILALAAFYRLRERVSAQLTLAIICALWALPPLGDWATASLASLMGDPVFVGDVPGWRDVALRLLPAAAAFGLIRFPEGIATREKLPDIDTRWLSVPILLVSAHALFKQAFAIETVTAFTSYGLAERTVWQALLLGGAWWTFTGIPRLGQSRMAAIVLAGAVLAHFAIYTLFWHNPLFDRQAVGPVPIANIALAAYFMPVAATLLLRQWIEARWRPVADGLVVALVSLCTLTLLRQAFAGSILIDVPMTQGEDLLRSLLGIVLAIAFLFLGSHRGERSWRVGSLILMLLAVGKVFIFDAAGLEGLLRIASFMALGFSLIGIGWLYNRQLRGAYSNTG